VDLVDEQDAAVAVGLDRVDDGLEPSLLFTYPSPRDLST
jgi:hypothetical protein